MKTIVKILRLNEMFAVQWLSTGGTLKNTGAYHLQRFFSLYIEQRYKGPLNQLRTSSSTLNKLICHIWYLNCIKFEANLQCYYVISINVINSQTSSLLTSTYFSSWNVRMGFCWNCGAHLRFLSAPESQEHRDLIIFVMGSNDLGDGISQSSIYSQLKGYINEYLDFAKKRWF